MPPFFDQVQLHHALQNQVNPLLEAHANGNLHNRSLGRFDRDDPPPYASSTESEEFDHDFAPLPPLPRGELPEELKAIMEPPISDDELKTMVTLYDLGSMIYPADFYRTEAKREERRLELEKNYRLKFNRIFRGVEGARRRGVIVRHNVKSRWKKLGVWNPEWGFAGRNGRPSDDAFRWKWRWEQHIADSSGSGYVRDTYVQQLMERALRLRQNLRRGESAPVLPRSHLKQDATASEAESFIISRPWVMFQVELAEERIRYHRLSREQRRCYPCTIRKQVIAWWKERGDWREEFDERNWVTSWKWRHESPSPEPEDLTPINNMKDSPLDTTDMDFTPSEIDELETIELPLSEQPKDVWTSKGDSLLPSFPGQLWQRPEPAYPPIAPKEPLPPRPSIFGPVWPLEEEHDEVLSKDHEDTPPQEPEENPPQPQRDTPNPPPPQKQPQQQQRRYQLRDRVDKAQDRDRDRDQPVPVRRSARIAAMKRPAEPLPLQAAEAPNKKRRVGATSKAAAPAAPQPTTRETRRMKTRLVPARPPKKETEIRLKQGRRGGPFETGGRAKHVRSAVVKKPAKTPAPVGRGRMRDMN